MENRDLTPLAPFALLAAVVLASQVIAAQPATKTADAALIARARGIHERVITLDTHNDIDPANFTQLSRNYTADLGNQVNLPKMSAGGLDASFFVVYVGQATPPTTPDAFEAAGYQRAYSQAIAKFDAIHRLTEKICARSRSGSR